MNLSRNIRRYGRAFIVALRLTLRGEKPPLLQVRDRYPHLAAWWDQTAALVSAVERAAAASGIDPEQVKIHADKRDVAMATILRTVRYHAEHEYPYLFAHNDQYDSLMLQAINLNDRYLVMRLSEAVDAPVKPALEALAAHLLALPPAENEAKPL